jgi:Mn-dependent DtxR family transcriptional regulator
MKITSLAVDNLDLLHTLDATEPASFNALGDTLDRDPANVRKTVLRLREEGLVAEDALDLTENGRALTRLITATRTRPGPIRTRSRSTRWPRIS